MNLSQRDKPLADFPHVSDSLTFADVLADIGRDDAISLRSGQVIAHLFANFLLVAGFGNPRRLHPTLCAYCLAANLYQLIING
jgi:hypothetical protein